MLEVEELGVDLRALIYAQRLDVLPAPQRVFPLAIFREGAHRLGEKRKVEKPIAVGGKGPKELVYFPDGHPFLFVSTPPSDLVT
jgi:hypothetical protein